MVREARSKYPGSMFISHPRSGLTWFRWMFHELRKRHDPENLKKHPNDGEEHNPLIAYDHDGMGLITTNQRHRMLPWRRGNNRWTKRKVVFLARDPRDVLLSNFYILVVRGEYLASRRRWVEGLDLNAFFRHKAWGLKILVEWLVWWEKNKRGCRDFMPLFYEETLANPLSALSCAVEMATSEEVPIETLEWVVGASTFEVMKQQEQQHGRLFTDQRGAINGDERTAIIRKGKAGQWKDELSEELQDWCDGVMEPLRGTFMERYTWRCNQ